LVWNSGMVSKMTFCPELMKIPTLFVLTCYTASLASLTSAEAPELKPLMAQPDKIVLQDDFSKAGPLNKQQWGARQGTRWESIDGVLRGQTSTPEFQAKKKDHKGVEARISAPVTPAQFVAKLSVRFKDGKETAVVPFIEFGHHVCRVRLSKEGTEVLADGESTRVAEAKDFKYEPGKWYHVLAELKGDEFVVQFAGGPTLYAKHEAFAKPNASGGNGLGIAGPKDGSVEIDNVTLWTIKPEAQLDWAMKRAALPAFKPATVKAKKEK
jgi:hypothetical protein